VPVAVVSPLVRQQRKRITLFATVDEAIGWHEMRMNGDGR
jgi:hypothetical protein